MPLAFVIARVLRFLRVVSAFKDDLSFVKSLKWFQLVASAATNWTLAYQNAVPTYHKTHRNFFPLPASAGGSFACLIL